MKKGITIVSLILYVSLFFTFSIITSSVVSAFNRNNFNDKGYIEINNEYLKLYSNLVNSSKNSERLDCLENRYVFSNGDTYEFDKEKNIILKNNSILCYNFFDIKINSDQNVNCDVEFKAFNNKLNRNIIVNVNK